MKQAGRACRQAGFIHLLPLILLLGGIIGGVYLVTGGPLNLFPRAASGPISDPVSPTPTPVPTPSPSPSPSPVPLTLSLSPTTLTGSGQVSFTWNIVGSPKSCSLSRTAGVTISGGTWNSTLRGSDVTSGSHTRTITVSNNTSIVRNVTFKITCKIDNVNQVATAAITVNPAIKPTVTLSANPTSVDRGGSTILTWTIGGGTPSSCSLSNSGNATISSGSWRETLKGDSVSASTYSRSITLTKTASASSRYRTFTIKCTNSGGSAIASTTVTVR